MTQTRLRQHVEAVAEVGSRYWSTPGFRAAMDYAEDCFQSWGYATHRQPFSIESDPHSQCWNLVATLSPVASEPPPEILLGAHLDSIAPGAKEGGPAPGADDNASGCALVLETARRLEEQNHSSPIRFVLFGAEEIGINGSRAYVHALTTEEQRALQEVWILDQVGLNTRPQPTLKLEGYKDRSERLMEKVESVAPETGLNTVRTYNPYGSDHMPFLEVRIPTLLLIQPDDEEDPLNHSVEDLPERLDYDYMNRILNLLTKMLCL